MSEREAPISSVPPGRSSIPEARASQLNLEAEIPSPPSQRSPSSVRPKQITSAQADQAFQRGLRHMRAEQWANAADEFGKAAVARGDSHEYKLYAAWASYKVCELEDERSVLRLELEDCARTLAKESRNNAFAPYVLGHMALAAENEKKALKLFRMATKLDPKNRDAERHVRVLSSRIEGGGKGKGRLGGLLS